MLKRSLTISKSNLNKTIKGLTILEYKRRKHAYQVCRLQSWQRKSKASIYLIYTHEFIFHYTGLVYSPRRTSVKFWVRVWKVPTNKLKFLLRFVGFFLI